MIDYVNRQQQLITNHEHPVTNDKRVVISTLKK